jgi:hypothetical protein
MRVAGGFLSFVPQEVTLLDTSSAQERLIFEQSFYATFSQVKTNRLIRHLWLWDHDACRLRTRIPYHEQRILVVRDGRGGVDTAMAINFSQTQLQGSWFGFSRPNEPGASCEILAYFSKGIINGVTMQRFLISSARYGEREGCRWADATCTHRLLPIYLRMGSRLVASCTIDGELRHQIRMDIATVSCKPSSLKLSLGA